MPRVTRAGHCVLVASLVFLFLAWSLGDRELVIPGWAGLFVVGAGMWWVRALPTLRIERTLTPGRVAAGSTVSVTVDVTNPGRRPTLPARAHDSIRNQRVEVAIPSIAPRGSSTLAYSLPAPQRGVTDVGPLTLGRDDPFGVCRAQRVLGGLSTLVVHPRVHPISLFPSGRVRDIEGPAADRALGSVSFHSLRDYVPGDDLRRIHWRMSARLGNLLVREHVDASQPHLGVVLDTGRHAYDGEAFEAAIEAAASIGVIACLQRFPLNLTTSAGETLFDRSLGSDPVSLLDQLAALGWSEATQLTRAVRAVREERRASAFVLITGRKTEDAIALVAEQRERADHNVIVHFDSTAPAGATSPMAGVTEITAPTATLFADLWNGATK